MDEIIKEESIGNFLKLQLVDNQEFDFEICFLIDERKLDFLHEYAKYWEELGEKYNDEFIFSRYTQQEKAYNKFKEISAKLKEWYDTDFHINLLDIEIALPLLLELKKRGDLKAVKHLSMTIIRYISRDYPVTDRKFIFRGEWFTHCTMKDLVARAIESSHFTTIMRKYKETSSVINYYKKNYGNQWTYHPHINVFLNKIKEKKYVIVNDKLVLYTEQMNLSNMGIKTLKEIKGYERLEAQLELDGNELEDIDSIVDLKGILHLNLNGNKLKTLPDGIGKFSMMRTLRINDNKLESLPDSIGELKSLKSVYLSRNNLKELPESFGKLENLEFLRLKGNKLKKLPESFGNLKNLKNLELDGNELKNLPSSIRNLTELAFLDISCNKMESFPESLMEMEKLQHLNMGRNKLTKIPKSICGLKSLIILQVSGNQISEIHGNIGDLPHLEEFRVNENQLKAIPAPIGNLSNLKVLTLGYNMIEEIPEDVGNLKNLTSLDLRNNQLSTLPASLQNLTSLKSLSVSSNNIKEIPVGILMLKNLQRFNG